MAGAKKVGKYIAFYLTPELLEEVDAYRTEAGIRSRTDAVINLILLGLKYTRSKGGAEALYKDYNERLKQESERQYRVLEPIVLTPKMIRELVEGRIPRVMVEYEKKRFGV